MLWDVASCNLSAVLLLDGQALHPGSVFLTTISFIMALSIFRWHTWTCVLGEQVNGIWGKYAQTNDINAADAVKGVGTDSQILPVLNSAQQPYPTHLSLSPLPVATGDDFGKVNLVRFPCTRKGAKSRTYVGHSAHVTNVRFTGDQSRLLSTGGGDQSIFQWRLDTGGGPSYGSHEEEVARTSSPDCLCPA